MAVVYQDPNRGKEEENFIGERTEKHLPAVTAASRTVEGLAFPELCRGVAP